MQRTKIHTAALPQSSSPGTSIDLKSAFTLLLSRIDETEPIIANATKTNNLLHEIITAQEQDKLSLPHDLSEHQGYDLGEHVRRLFDNLRLVNMDIDFTVDEVVKYQAKSTSNLSIV